MGGASWNRTTMIPASTGCNRTISAKAPGSLYEDRTHPTGSKDRRPNQLGEQTIFADDERFELSTLPLTRARSATELIIRLVTTDRLELSTCIVSEYCSTPDYDREAKSSLLLPNRTRTGNQVRIRHLLLPLSYGSLLLAR